MRSFRLALLSLVFATSAFAQQSVQMRPGDAGPIVFDSSNNMTINTTGNITTAGRTLGSGAAPVPSSCGGAGLALAGTDAGGTVTVGSSATTNCTITFTRAWPSAPHCIVAPASGILAALSWTTSTTAITVTQTSTASNTLKYLCVGTP